MPTTARLQPASAMPLMGKQLPCRSAVEGGGHGAYWDKAALLACKLRGQYTHSHDQEALSMAKMKPSTADTDNAKTDFGMVGGAAAGAAAGSLLGPLGAAVG